MSALFNDLWLFITSPSDINSYIDTIIDKINKTDRIEIEYAEADSDRMSKTKVVFSSNYKVWYDYDSKEDYQVNITALNVQVDNVVYRNIDGIKINDDSKTGVLKGVCTIEVIADDKS